MFDSFYIVHMSVENLSNALKDVGHKVETVISFKAASSSMSKLEDFALDVMTEAVSESIGTPYHVTSIEKHYVTTLDEYHTWMGEFDIQIIGNDPRITYLTYSRYKEIETDAAYKRAVRRSIERQDWTGVMISHIGQMKPGEALLQSSISDRRAHWMLFEEGARMSGLVVQALWGNARESLMRIHASHAPDFHFDSETKRAFNLLSAQSSASELPTIG